MSNLKKRTFSQVQDEDDRSYVDLSECSPTPKKQKLNYESKCQSELIPNEQSQSPSVEILSPFINKKLPPHSPTDSTKILETDNKICINNADNNWLNDNDCLIVQHRLQKDWYHFKIVSKQNNSQFAWLKHDDLQHLNIYNNYLKQTDLPIDEVTNPLYIPQEILQHQYNEEMDEITFYIKWEGYNQLFNSWEPPQMLQGNELYIKYCKKHCIEVMEISETSAGDEDDNEVGYSEETVNAAQVDETDTVSFIDDGQIDIDDEYNMAMKQNKQFTVEYIVDITNAIDERVQFLFGDNVCAANVEREANKLMDIRDHFEGLKGGLLFKQLQEKENNHNNMMDAADDIDEILIIAKTVNSINMKTPQNNKKKRKTLFDYSFTPTASINNKKTKSIIKRQSLCSILGTNHNKNNNNHNKNKNVENEEIPLDHLSQTNSCYGCKRKWPLFGIEYFKSFPICNKCPSHIRLGHNRKPKEQWFCPYCHHSAKCMLFPAIKAANKAAMDIDIEIDCNDNFGTDGIPLTAICDSKYKIYLYIKPNKSKYWQTYIPLSVNDEDRGDILVKKPNKSKNSNIILSDVPCKHILWAFNDSKQQKPTSNREISSIVSWNNDKVVLKLGRKSKPITVCRAQVIANDKYLNKLCTQSMKKCKRNGLQFDRSKIFKHSRYFKEQKKLKDKKRNIFGENTIITESAPLNSRYFNDEKEDKKDDEQIIPNYAETTNELLSHFNVTSVPKDLLSPPLRHIKLDDIKQYPLILVVGPSGSGKSTLLKSLQAQNPSLITFKNPENLEWDNSKCIISQFGNIPIETAMNNMSSIGLNNIRTWLKPFNILSAGEQYRCAFARLLQESINTDIEWIFLDEFTSVLDRTNARCMSAATSKCIRKNNKMYNNNTSNFILASANADIIRYLQPDLLILLGGRDEMKLIPNPNNLSDARKLFDVRTVLDLPQFAKLKENIDQSPEFNKSIQKLTKFDGLKALKRISIDNEVRELKCNVLMDDHAKQTSLILDVEDFKGECITHIPCLQRKHMNFVNSCFNIGIIVGPSGCGKTTSGERLFGRPQEIKWDSNRNIASHFKSIQNLSELFCAVDLSLNIAFSFYHFLSEGEKHRVNIARYLDGNNNVLIDEFTSYLDRITAKKVAKGVSDYIYKYNKQNIVFLCCKYDIISDKNGIYPSWIFDVQNKQITHYKPPSTLMHSPREVQHELDLYPKHRFIDITKLWNPPKIRLVLRQCRKHDFSPTFAKYHYMDASINGSAKCYSVWAYFTYSSAAGKDADNDNKKRSDKEEASDDENAEDMDLDGVDDAFYDENELQLVGFFSFMNHYGMNNVKMADDSRKQFDYREHRTVILPAFQGLGFGSRIADSMGEYLALHGFRLHSKTAHPRYGGYRNKKPSLWIPTKNNGTKMTRKQWKQDADRMLYGANLKDVGAAKRYYIHVYKLHADKERTNESNQLLKTRVIVKKTYKMINE